MNRFKTALSTFLSFLLIGFVPVFPFILPIVNPLMWSLGFTFTLFFLIGVVEGFLSKKRKLLTGFGVLLIGIVAAVLSYGVGRFLAGIV